MKNKRSKKVIDIRIDYSIKYDVSTEYPSFKQMGFCEMYGLDKIQKRYYYETFRSFDNKEDAIEYAKKYIMSEVKHNSPCARVAIRFDSINAF